MILTFVVTGSAMLAVAGFTVNLAKRLHPAHCARFTLGVLLTGLFLIVSGLFLWSAPVILDLVGLTDLAAICRRMIGGIVPGGVAGGVLAGIVALWIVARAFKAWWDVLGVQRLLRIEPLIPAKETADGYDVFVLESARPMAYTVGGGKPQVVLTSSVVSGLTPDLVDVIMAHEGVHARNRHHTFLALTAALEAAMGWLPPVAGGAENVRLSLERWADEDASLTLPEGREKVREALLEVCIGQGIPGLAGFGAPEMVSARVSALSQPVPSRVSAWITGGYFVFGVGAIVSAGSVGWATRTSIIAVVHAGQCLT